MGTVKALIEASGDPRGDLLGLPYHPAGAGSFQDDLRNLDAGAGCALTTPLDTVGCAPWPVAVSTPWVERVECLETRMNCGSLFVCRSGVQ